MHNRRLAGKRAKYAGASFENQFENLCAIQNVTCVRIPDGCKTVGPNKMIRVSTPFDYVIGFNGKAGFIDTKVTLGDNFTFSMIKPHQLESLLSLAHCGVSGYIIGFGSDVYFANARLLRETQKHDHVDIKRAIHLGSRISFDVRRIFNE